MAVTLSEEGTKVNTEEQVKDANNQLIASTVETQTPADASKVSPKDKVEDLLYTQSQTDDLIHAAKSEAGRLQKEAETERDGFKAKAEQAEATIEDTQSERDKLQTDIEELTGDDPKKFDIIARDKTLRGLKRELEKGTNDLAKEVKVHEEIVTVARETNLGIAIRKVSTEYTAGDPVKLKNLCATLGITDEVKLREVADELWEKKAEVKAAPAEGDGETKEKLILDKGTNHGGGEATEQDRLDNMYPSMAKKK